MASISHDGNGFRRILFKLNGKRIGIRLGHISLRSAETIRTHLEEILEAHGIGRSIEPDTLKWLREVDSDLHAKFAEKGLAPSRSTPSTAEVGQFVDDYIAKRSAKPASKEIWRQGKLGLVAFFGANRPLSVINAGMADDYVEYLKTLPIKSRARKPGEATAVKVLAPMTVWKRLQFAKMVFRAAARHKLIEADPFADVKYKPTKPDRSQFITPEETAKLLDGCPAGPDWRLIVAMARWGGLHAPQRFYRCNGPTSIGNATASLCIRPRPNTTPEATCESCRCSPSYAASWRPPGRRNRPATLWTRNTASVQWGPADGGIAISGRRSRKSSSGPV